MRTALLVIALFSLAGCVVVPPLKPNENTFITSKPINEVVHTISTHAQDCSGHLYGPWEQISQTSNPDGSVDLFAHNKVGSYFGLPMRIYSIYPINGSVTIIARSDVWIAWETGAQKAAMTIIIRKEVFLAKAWLGGSDTCIASIFRSNLK